jgi:dolichol-phosphate mannosyltransferase
VNDLCILLPVINEADNLRFLLPEIFRLFPGAQVLIVDDNSTDETAEVILRERMLGMKIEHLKNPTRLGIGAAHKSALRFAAQNGFRYLCTMDADLTHDPSEIDKLFLSDDSVDIAIGSRFAEGGKMENWSLSRKILARVGHIVTQKAFSMELDMSSSFRLYRRLDSVDFNLLEKIPNGYDYFFTSTIIFGNSGYSFVDQGVRMNQRLNGKSKMTLSYVYRGVWRIISWRVLLKRRIASISESH